MVKIVLSGLFSIWLIHCFWFVNNHTKHLTYNILLELFNLYFNFVFYFYFKYWLLRYISSILKCLRTIKTSNYDKNKTRYQYTQGRKDKANKTASKFTLIHLHNFKALTVLVYCFSIGGILYIVISNKSISQIERHTHTFCCFCFDQNVSIQHYITYFNHNYLKSRVFSIIIFQKLSLKNIFQLRQR